MRRTKLAAGVAGAVVLSLTAGVAFAEGEREFYIGARGGYAHIANENEITNHIESRAISEYSRLLIEKSTIDERLRERLYQELSNVNINYGEKFPVIFEDLSKTPENTPLNTDPKLIITRDRKSPRQVELGDSFISNVAKEKEARRRKEQEEKDREDRRSLAEANFNNNHATEDIKKDATNVLTKIVGLDPIIKGFGTNTFQGIVSNQESGLLLSSVVGIDNAFDAGVFNIRAEIEAGYASFSLKSSNPAYKEKPIIAGTETLNTDAEIIFGFANLFADYPLTESAELIVGGGVGLADLNLKVQPDRLPSSNSEFAFGYNAGVGVGLALTDRAAVEVLYRYVGFHPMDSNANSVGVTAHTVTAGLRFSL